MYEGWTRGKFIVKGKRIDTYRAKAGKVKLYIDAQLVHLQNEPEKWLAGELQDFLIEREVQRRVRARVRAKK